FMKSVLAAGGGCAVTLLPFSLDLLRSSGTALYPILGRGFPFKRERSIAIHSGNVLIHGPPAEPAVRPVTRRDPDHSRTGNEHLDGFMVGRAAGDADPRHQA